MLSHNGDGGVLRCILESSSCPVAPGEAWRLRNRMVNRLALVSKDWWVVVNAGEASALQRGITNAALFLVAMLTQGRQIVWVGHFKGELGARASGSKGPELVESQ